MDLSPEKILRKRDNLVIAWRIQLQFELDEAWLRDHLDHLNYFQVTWKFPNLKFPSKKHRKAGTWKEQEKEREERGSAIDRRRPSGMASGFTTPPPSGQGRGQRSTGRKRKTQRKSAVKQAKTPLSTLLKKASENRVLRDAKLVSMANRKCVSSFSFVSNARTDDGFASICPTFCRSSSGSARLQTSWRALGSSRP